MSDLRIIADVLMLTMAAYAINALDDVDAAYKPTEPSVTPPPERRESIGAESQTE